MAPKIDDRWLWVGLGIFTFLAIKGVSHGLHEIVRLTEVHNKPKEALSIPKIGKEDAIKTESLLILATCDNIEIRKSATKILCERFYSNSHARRLLALDWQSKDPARRRVAKKAYDLLVDNGAVLDCTPVMPQGLRRNLSYSRLPYRGARARNHEESLEEQELRRRRREAMVINEGDRPVSQDDIIQQGGRGGRMSAEEARVAEQALATISGRDRD